MSIKQILFCRCPHIMLLQPWNISIMGLWFNSSVSMLCILRFSCCLLWVPGLRLRYKSKPFVIPLIPQEAVFKSHLLLLFIWPIIRTLEMFRAEVISNCWAAHFPIYIYGAVIDRKGSYEEGKSRQERRSYCYRCRIALLSLSLHTRPVIGTIQHWKEEIRGLPDWLPACHGIRRTKWRPDWAK